ncbi:MAG: energy-coupled thiamine transporter ThiT, partial [Erysipelotrichaceae bacterium]|nr:energy-coupled thiamine transporter ThiT [Erysipelotrichaceae bacterium]
TGFLLDYLFAFSAYGLAPLFPNKGWFYSGVLITNLIRFCCSVLSGVIVWETPLWGSITYNATYMLPTLIAGLVLIPFLIKTVTKRLPGNQVR